MRINSIVVAIVCTCVSSAAQASLPQRLFGEGDLVEINGQMYPIVTINSYVADQGINTTTVLPSGSNGVGGFVARAAFDLNTDDFLFADYQLLMGRTQGSDPVSVLRSVGTYDGFQQSTFNHSAIYAPAMSDSGQITYTSAGTIVSSGTSVTGIFRDDDMIWPVDDPPSYPGVRDMIVAPDGSISLSTSGIVAANFYGDLSTPEFFASTASTTTTIDLGAQGTVGARDYVTSSALSSGSTFAASSNGNSLIGVRARTNENANVISTNDQMVFLNGSLLTTSIGTLREGVTPNWPSGVNLAAGALQGFENMAINNAGDYLLTGDTTNNVSDHFVMYNGQVVLWEGKTVNPGDVLNGHAYRTDLNESSDWALLWSHTTDSSNEGIYLSFDDSGIFQKVVYRGMTVQIDEDTTGTLADVAISLELSERQADGSLNIFFAGRLEGGGINDEAFFMVNVMPLQTTIATGDFNDDGIVDAADYTVWRDNSGLTTGATLAMGDGNGDGAVDTNDYDLWRQQFGTAGGGSSALAPQAVPEPATVLVLAAAGGSLLLARRRTTWA